MAEHTPGPWLLDNPRHIRSGYRDICRVFGLFDDDEADANACLIAAAPDLLEACRDLINRLDIVRLRGYVGHPLVESVRAAIAKAEGK